MPPLKAVGRDVLGSHAEDSLGEDVMWGVQALNPPTLSMP